MARPIWWTASTVLLLLPASALIPEPLSRLLLQRAVQTQVMYFADFHDEVKGTWLSEFGGPCAELTTNRLSNQETIPKYHGLDAFTAQSPEAYMRSMLKAEPIHYAVKYKVGTPDMQNKGPGEGDGAASDEDRARAAAAAIAMWGAAGSAAGLSRRSNPFLAKKEPKYIEYDEEIVPARLCQLLMATRLQLAREWERDLMAVAEGTIEGHFDDREASIASAYARAVRPVQNDDGSWEPSSPLRQGSLDLCERLSTREATLDLCERGLDKRQTNWLQTKLVEDLPPGDEDEDSSSKIDPDDLTALLAAAVCRVTESDPLGRHDRRRGVASRWLSVVANALPEEGVQPKAIAATIIQRRADLAREWAQRIVPTVEEEHTRLLASNLEAGL